MQRSQSSDASDSTNSSSRTFTKRMSTKIYMSIARRVSFFSMSEYPDYTTIENAIEKDYSSLIKAILHIKGDYVIKIHFIRLVNRMRAETDPVEQIDIGFRIIDLFVNTEMFCIKTFSKQTSAGLVMGHTEKLYEGRMEMIRELASVSEIVDAANFSVAEHIDQQ